MSSSMALSSMSRMTTSVCLLSASSPVNIALQTKGSSRDFTQRVQMLNQQNKPQIQFSRSVFCVLVPEVGAAGRQNNAMGVNLLGTHHQHHITELTVFPQQVDHLQCLPRMFVRDVGHACRLGDPFRELVGVPQCTAAGDVHSSGVLTCAGGPREKSNSQL